MLNIFGKSNISFFLLGIWTLIRKLTCILWYLCICNFCFGQISYYHFDIVLYSITLDLYWYKFSLSNFSSSLLLSATLSLLQHRGTKLFPPSLLIGSIREKTVLIIYVWTEVHKEKCGSRWRPAEWCLDAIILG